MINIKFDLPPKNTRKVSELIYGQTFIHKNFPGSVFMSTRMADSSTAYEIRKATFEPIRHVDLCSVDEVTLVDLDIIVKVQQ